MNKKSVAWEIRYSCFHFFSLAFILSLGWRECFIYVLVNRSRWLSSAADHKTQMFVFELSLSHKLTIRHPHCRNVRKYISTHQQNEYFLILLSSFCSLSFVRCSFVILLNDGTNFIAYTQNTMHWLQVLLTKRKLESHSLVAETVDAEKDRHTHTKRTHFISFAIHTFTTPRHVKHQNFQNSW